MNKMKIFYYIALITLFVFIDQITKQWAWQNGETPAFHSWVILYKNYNFFLSSFQDLSVEIKSFCFGISFFIVCFTVYIINYLFKGFSRILTFSSLVFISGMIGNTIDRLKGGFVRDFINIPLPVFNKIIFNIADVCILLGAGLFIFSLYNIAEHLASPTNKRLNIFFHWKKQIQLIFPIIIFSFFTAFLLVIFQWLLLRFLQGKIITEKEILVLSLGHIAVLGLSLLFGIVLVFKWSFHLIGPVYAFRNWVNNFKSGSLNVFRLRKDDRFKELEEVAAQLLEAQDKNTATHS
jgi:signal peptidase II